MTGSEGAVTHVNVNVDSIFHEVKELNKANKRLTILFCICAACAVSKLNESKKQKEQIKTLTEELEGLRTSIGG